MLNKHEGQDGLIRALKAEEQWSTSYLRAELEEAQIDAFKRYYGDEYGDEVDGRSRVTTREVYETIQWLRPDLKRTFLSGDEVCQFEGVTPESDRHAQSATDYINYVFLRDNAGERELDAFIFDGLLHRVGVIACEWREAEWAAAQEVSGINTMQAQALLQQQEQGRLRIEAQDIEQKAPDEAHPDGVFITLKIRPVERPAGAEVFTIAPEDFRIAARSVDLRTARYCGDVVRMMKGEAKLKWPDYEEEIDAGSDSSGGFNADERRAERFRDMENWDQGSNREGEGDASEIEIMREYIRYDLDEDGYPELIRCYRLGDCLLEQEEVDEHIYAHWTPNPIPHRFYGLGIADEAGDLQRTKTVLLRAMLDSVYQSVVPRIGYDKNADVDLNALLTVRPGVAIGVAGPPGDKIFPIQVPDLSGSALTALQWIDKILESRTGVTRQAQGFDPDLLHDTARGVELMQNAQSVRKEEIARNLAVGLEEFFMKLYRLVHKHQNEARAIKVSGEWRNIDPRAWEADMRCTVSAGLGTGAREKQVIMLQMLQADQAAAVQTFGPNNPSVGPMELYEMVKEKARAIGFKSVDRWFKPPIDPQTGQPWQPQPQPSPDQQKVQAQIQEGQARLQMDAQKAQQDAQLKQYETNAKAGADAQKAQLDAEIARMRAEGELRIEQARAEAQLEIERQKMLMQAQLAERQFAFEAEMKRREAEFNEQLEEKKLALMAKQKRVNGAAPDAGSSTHFGGEPG